MIPNIFYYRLANGPVFGPYQEPDFWRLAEEKRISDETNLSSLTDGPWLPLRQFLAQEEIQLYYYLDANQQPRGPDSSDYLKLLLAQSRIDNSCPVSETPKGPWKLLSERDLKPVPIAPATILERAPASAKSTPIQTTSSKSRNASKRNKFLLATILLSTLALFGAVIGAGKPFSAEGFIISSLLNPFTWLACWSAARYSQLPKK